jgi:transposase
MNKYKETFGVDISKDVFDVHGSINGQTQYKNDAQGFKKFLKELPKDVLVVMEAKDIIIIDSRSFFIRMT